MVQFPPFPVAVTEIPDAPKLINSLLCSAFPIFSQIADPDE